MLIALLILVGVAVVLLILGRPLTAAAIHRLFQDSDPYPPEAADPVDEHFTTAPREGRITKEEADRLVEQFNWGRYETWLKEPS